MPSSSENTPKIVAHRGSSAYEPENTLQAFEHAWALGADIIECDVHLSKDKQVIVSHDHCLDRCWGIPDNIYDLNAKEIGRIEVAYSRGPARFKARIPRLEEVLATIPEGKGIYIDIKTGPEIIRPLQKVLREAKLDPEQVTFICFSLETIKAVKTSFRDYKCHWIVEPKGATLSGSLYPTGSQMRYSLEDAQPNLNGVDLKYHSAMDLGFVESLKKHGFEVHVWNVKHEEEARHARQIGVDSITLDDLLLKGLRPEPGEADV